MQQGMIFHSLHVDQGLYLTQTCVELEGDLQVNVLRQSWEQVMQRHTVLRTSFEWERVTEPLQVVQRTAELPWEQQDWRDAGEKQQADLLAQYLAEDRARGFALDHAPLMRLMAIRIAERRFCLIWSHHHVVLDGWSIATVWTEVLRYYNANRNGTPLQLPKSKPYVEYIQWLQHQDQKSSEDFWRELLKDANPTPVGI